MEEVTITEGWVYYNKNTKKYARWFEEDYDSGHAFLGDRWIEEDDPSIATMYSSSNPRHDQFHPSPDLRRFKLKKVR